MRQPHARSNHCGRLKSLLDEIEREDIDDFLINQRTSSFFEHRKPLTFPNYPPKH